MPLWRFLCFLLLGLLGMILLTVWFFPTTTDFRTQNPFWNGLENFSNEFAATAIDSLTALPEDTDNVVLLVIPYAKLDGVALERLRRYVEKGGTLILADDYGYGNDVLKHLGVPARFQGVPVLDPLFNYHSAVFALATNLAPSPITEGVSSIAFNYGTVLEGEGLNEVAFTSGFSFQDSNNDGVHGVGEPRGPFPVVAYTTVGAGRLVLIADPSIFVNTMFGAKDNATLTRNLIHTAGDDPMVFIDQSHLRFSRLDELRSTLGFIREVVARPGIITTLSFLTIIIVLSPIWRKKEALT